MNAYAVCSAAISLPLGIQPGQPTTAKVELPENAIPLQMEYRAPTPEMQQPQMLLHYLVPCDDAGQALCEICNRNTADYEGIICMQCKAQDAEAAENAPPGAPA